VFVNTPEGQIQVQGAGAKFVSYVDEHGQLVRAYTLDGATWIRAFPGQTQPVIEIDTPLSKVVDTTTGETVLQDTRTGDAVFKQGPDGSWAANGAYFNANPGVQAWFGQANYAATDAATGLQSPDANARGAGFLNVADMGLAIGAPGQQMQLVTMSDSGALNFLPPPPVYGHGKGGTASHIGKQADDLYRATGGLSGALVSGTAASIGKQKDDTSWAQLAAQLPPDTPARLNGKPLGDFRPPDAIIRPLPPLPGTGPTKAPILPPLLGKAKDDLTLAGVKPVLPPLLLGKAKDDLVLPPPPKQTTTRPKRPPAAPPPKPPSRTTNITAV
jgi:hypothetical protein